jgi:hypothetical protein
MADRKNRTTTANHNIARVLVVLAVVVSNSAAAQVPAKRSIIGTVTSDSAGAHGIGNVELTIPALDIGTRSNWMGEFRLTGVPPGRWRVDARRVGYGSTSDSVTVASDAGASLNFVLQPAPVALDSVVTRADAQPYISPNLRGFIERMNAHQGGYFVADSVLRENQSKPFSNVLEGRAPGLELYRSGSNVYAMTGRYGGAAAQCGVFQRCRAADGKPIASSPQVPQRCYVTVYLDGVQLFDPAQVSPRSPPTNLNSIDVTSLTGVEYYPSAQSAPAEYQSTSPCGALLLWTREK